MQITLYMGTTIDGFIAKTNGDSDWVSPIDAENFEKTMMEYGCIIVGRKTFEQFQGDLYPVKGILNIVMTSDESMTSDDPEVMYASQSPDEIVHIIEEKGHDKALLIGGGTTNSVFAKAGLINEVILSIHPLAFGQGIHLFEGAGINMKLTLDSSEVLEDGVIRARYSVNS